MRLVTHLTLLLIFLALSPALAQKTVEHYPSGEKKYQGRMADGKKIGTHTYWYENGQKKKQEKYNENGVLVRLREWNENGELTKDEKPEELMAKMRVEQFAKMNWIELPEGVSFYKIKGNNSPKTSSDLTNYIVHYAIYLEDGSEIESSLYSNTPIPVNLEKHNMIDGFVIGLKHFNEGDNGFIKIPHRLAYGSEGTKNIPAYSTLVFQVIVMKAE